MRWDQRSEKGRFEDQRKAQEHKLRKVLKMPPPPDQTPAHPLWPIVSPHINGPVTWYGAPQFPPLPPGVITASQGSHTHQFPPVQYPVPRHVVGLGNGTYIFVEDRHTFTPPDPDEVERQSLRDQLRKLQADG